MFVSARCCRLYASLLVYIRNPLDLRKLTCSSLILSDVFSGRLLFGGCQTFALPVLSDGGLDSKVAFSPDGVVGKALFLRPQSSPTVVRFLRVCLPKELGMKEALIWRLTLVSWALISSQFSRRRFGFRRVLQPCCRFTFSFVKTMFE